jgi:hypothetical protein
MNLMMSYLTRGIYKTPAFIFFGALFILFSSNNLYSQDPTITDVNPTSLCVGETVTITGTNLITGAPTRINFNGADVTDFDAPDEFTIEFTAPAASANNGSADVKTELFYGDPEVSAGTVTKSIYFRSRFFGLCKSWSPIRMGVFPPSGCPE